MSDLAKPYSPSEVELLRVSVCGNEIAGSRHSTDAVTMIQKLIATLDARDAEIARLRADNERLRQHGGKMIIESDEIEDSLRAEVEKSKRVIEAADAILNEYETNGDVLPYLLRAYRIAARATKEPQ